MRYIWENFVFLFLCHEFLAILMLTCVKFWDSKDLQFDEKHNTNLMNLKIRKEERDREEFTPQ